MLQLDSFMRILVTANPVTCSISCLLTNPCYLQALATCYMQQALVTCSISCLLINPCYLQALAACFMQQALFTCKDWLYANPGFKQSHRQTGSRPDSVLRLTPATWKACLYATAGCVHSLVTVHTRATYVPDLNTRKTIRANPA